MDRAGNDRILFAEFQLDRSHRRLYRNGVPVQLYAKAFELLEFLINHNGTAVSKSEILDKVWPDQFVEEANLSVQVSALRKALGATTNEPRFLITVPGVGYKFVADIRTPDDALIADGNVVVSDLIAEEHARLTNERPATEPASESPSARRWIFGIAALTLVSAVGIGSVWYFYSAQKPRVTSLAVLPFVNQDQTPEREYLGEGLADSVIHSLSRLSELRVVSRNSSFRFRGNEPDAATIGRELDVDAILTGRIVNEGDNLSIRAELISTSDNSVVWGEQFTRRLADVERLQTDIARSISEKLRLKLSIASNSILNPAQTTDPEAYRLYLLGRFHLNKFTDEGFFKSRDHFQQAIDKDPNYALAYSGLAEAYNRLCGYNAMPSSECFPKSRVAAERALELDDGLADAHATLASVKHFYDWDWAGAEKQFGRAIELDPHNSSAHHLFSYHLSGMGRFDESLEAMRLSRELDPLSVEKTVGIAEVLYFQKRYEEALAQADRALELDKNAGFVQWLIGNIYRQQGRFDDAIAQYERAIPLSGGSSDERASLAHAYALAGREDEARRILTDLKKRASTQFISPCVLAIVHAGLDEKDEAFELLEHAYRGRDFMLTLLKIEPSYDRLRDDPRYAHLMRRVGFTD